MTPTETTTILRQFNEWQRGDGPLDYVPSGLINAIDAAVEMIERLEAAESDALEQARLNGMGASREAALMAKLEAAEKSDAESFAVYRKARDERDALRVELETERVRLAACGVVALANTPDSAKKARDMRPEYWSASCNDVARLVAAAPDLLDELLSVLDWAVTERAPLREQEIESIRKVIAKATGESKLPPPKPQTSCGNSTSGARIEAMEKQEPVAWCATDETGTVIEALGMNQSRRFDTALYLAPGAQPAPSISPVALRHVIQWLRNGCDPMKAADELELLAAATEAKP